MSISATVIIPTFNHGPTLYYSVASVQNQTVRDIEIFIIGDGAPSSTEAIVAELAKNDSRIRYFSFPKDSSKGEVYRDEIIKRHATGEIICYHSDDDLMLPNHIEVMKDALKEADFAHTLPLRIFANGSVDILCIDLSQERFRNLILQVENRIPLSNAAHTMYLYQRLPFGWRTTPKGMPSDHYMWQQILSQSWCRPVSINKPTIVNFPSPQRLDWTLDGRVAELKKWQLFLSKRDEYYLLLEKAIHSMVVSKLNNEVRFDNSSLVWQEEQKKLTEHVNNLTAGFESERKSFLQQLSTLEDEKRNLVNMLEDEKRNLVNKIESLEKSLTWRLSRKLMKYRIIRWPLKFLAKALIP